MKKILVCIFCLMYISAFSQKSFTLDDVYKRGLFYEDDLASLNWMNDGQFYSALISNQIKKFDVTTGEEVATLVDGQSLGISIDDYQFSKDETKILLLTDKQSIYRRSYTADYYIYTVSNKELKKVSENGRQSYVSFSPDNSKVAFVRENNLYMVELDKMNEFAVTGDGKFGEIINGSSDWVYEEELKLVKAFKWSPDGKKIAYIRFDESEVTEYNLQYWDEGSLYPRDYRYKFPKAGEDNSKVSVHVYELSNKKTTKVDMGKDEDFYIPKIQWTKNPNLLSIMKLNRLQDRLSVYHANATSGKAILIFYEKAEKYLNVYDAHELIYLNNKTQFIFATTERNGYKHFYLHHIDGQHIRQITKGGWEVDEFIGIDESKKTPVIYYTSTEVSPLERHLYKIDINGRGKTKLSPSEGMNSVDMSKDFKYYILSNESSSRPLSVNLMSSRGNKLIDSLITNNRAKDQAIEYGLSQKQFFNYETVDQTSINGYLLKPAEFDSTKQYPVLVFQYSGPGSQMVKNEWSGSHFFFHQTLTQLGYVVAVVDPRGTGGRGEAFKKSTYRQMGQQETTDLIYAGRYLAEQPFFDKDRIGIWGWSYGGYASSVAMMKGAGVFSTCISVAPFSWEHYDTIYSERYMQRPEDNPDGYKASSLLTHAHKLKGNYLLVHGTGDDNVHYQVSMNLINKLVSEGKQFQTFFYPDKNHGMGGISTRLHLYEMMTDFLKTNL